MRLFLLCLLTSCFFLSGKNSLAQFGATGAWHSVTLQTNAAKTKNTALKRWQDTEEYLMQLSCFSDDDDEYSSIKKKAAVCSSCIFANNFAGTSLINNTAGLTGFNTSFCYPSLQRYLLHRVIVV
jgi:hypothetical protein